MTDQTYGDLSPGETVYLYTWMLCKLTFTHSFPAIFIKEMHRKSRVLSMHEKTLLEISNSTPKHTHYDCSYTGMQAFKHTHYDVVILACRHLFQHRSALAREGVNQAHTCNLNSHSGPQRRSYTSIDYIPVFLQVRGCSYLE